MVEVPLFASLRSVLGYAALVSAAAVFLPGHSQLTAGLAILVIALGWETLRPIARVIASLVVCVLLLAGLYNGQVLSSAFDGMAAITGLVLSVMFLSSVLGKSRDLEVISRRVFQRICHQPSFVTFCDVVCDVNGFSVCGTVRNTIFPRTRYDM